MIEFANVDVHLPGLGGGRPSGGLRNTGGWHSFRYMEPLLPGPATDVSALRPRCFSDHLRLADIPLTRGVPWWRIS